MPPKCLLIEKRVKIIRFDKLCGSLLFASLSVVGSRGRYLLPVTCTPAIVLQIALVSFCNVWLKYFFYTPP